MVDTSKFPKRSLTALQQEAKSAKDNHDADLRVYGTLKEELMWRISGGKIAHSSAYNLPDTYGDYRQWFTLQYGVDYVDTLIADNVNYATMMLDFETTPHGFGLRPLGEKQATGIDFVLTRLNLRKQNAKAHLAKFIVASGKSIFSGELPTPSTFDDFSRATIDLRSDGNWGMPLLQNPNQHHTSHTAAMAFSLFDRSVDSKILLPTLITRKDANAADKEKLIAHVYKPGMSGATYSAAKKNRWFPHPENIVHEVIKAITADLPTYSIDFTVYAPGAGDPTSFDASDYLNLSMIIQLHHQALLAGTPTDYWRKMFSKRIVVKRENDAVAANTGKEKVTKVLLYNADMRTGGISGTPSVLGVISGSETDAKRIASQYLPDVPLYSPGNNPNLATELRTTYKEMNLAIPELNKWLATTNKQDYRYVYVLENEWQPNERTFITARDLEIAQNYPSYIATASKTHYGRPSREFLAYLQTEAHSPTLLHHRAPTRVGSNYQTDRLSTMEGFGAFRLPGINRTLAPSSPQGGSALAVWAKDSQQKKNGFSYADFKLSTAIAGVKLPSKLKTAVFTGEGSIWKAKISVYAVSNESYAKAAEFMSRIIPLKVAEILNSVGASGSMPFGSYLTTNNSPTKLGTDIPMNAVPSESWGKVFDTTLKHFETKLESLFISDVKATLTPSAGTYGTWVLSQPQNVSFDQPAYYGEAYDSYIALAGAAAYLNGNAINKPGEYPPFLTSKQKLLAQGYIRSALGGELDVTPIASFAINDTEDIQNIHSNLKEYGSFQGMNEMPVLDIPPFNIKWHRGTDGLSGSAPFENIELFTLNETAPNLYNLPVRPYKADVYSGPSNEFGGLFHKQIMSMSLLFNDLKIDFTSAPITVGINVRIPINCTGVIGGSYGLRPGGSLDLNTITSAAGSYGLPTSFKLTGPKLFQGGALIYAAILSTVIYKKVVKNRYV